MAKLAAEETTSAIVDGILRFILAGGFITTALVAPNAIQVFDKPLTKMLDKLDKRSRERELRRIVHYMKQKGLISYTSRDYEHGMRITKHGKARIRKNDFAEISIDPPKKWDKRWRLIFFDIPISDNARRKMLTSKLGELGFKQLQKSLWVHPFPCRPEIEVITEVLGVRKFVTYIEITEIDAEDKLRRRFNSLLKNSTA